MPILLQVLGFTLLLWLAYKAGTWEKKVATELAVKAEEKWFFDALQVAHRDFARHGDFVGAWQTVCWLVRPPGVSYPVDPPKPHPRETPSYRE